MLVKANLTMEESIKKELEVQAKSMGLSISAYVRMLVMEKFNSKKNN